MKKRVRFKGVVRKQRIRGNGEKGFCCCCLKNGEEGDNGNNVIKLEMRNETDNDDRS